MKIFCEFLKILLAGYILRQLPNNFVLLKKFDNFKNGEDTRLPPPKNPSLTPYFRHFDTSKLPSKVRKNDFLFSKFQNDPAGSDFLKNSHSFTHPVYALRRQSDRQLNDTIKKPKKTQKSNLLTYYKFLVITPRTRYYSSLYHNWCMLHDRSERSVLSNRG